MVNYLVVDIILAAEVAVLALMEVAVLADLVEDETVLMQVAEALQMLRKIQVLAAVLYLKQMCQIQVTVVQV